MDSHMSHVMRKPVLANNKDAEDQTAVWSAPLLFTT